MGMILVDGGKVRLEGGIALLQVELSYTVNALCKLLTQRYGRPMAKAAIMEAVNDGMKLNGNPKSEFATFVQNILDEV